MSEEVTGYDALNFDGLERRGNYRFIAYREDMLHALDKKDAAATIYQIVYRWQVEYKREEVLRKIDERKKSGLKPYTQEEVEDMMFVYMSYNDFVHESGGAIGYNTVIRTLDYLVDKKKALKQRPNHDPKYPDFEYSVNKEVVRELLKALPPDPAFAPKIPKKKNRCTQMGTPENEENQSTQMGTGSTQTGIPSTHLGTEVYPNGGISQELTSNTQELTGKSNMSSSDDAPSPQSEKDEYEKRITELEERIAYLLQASKDGSYPPEPPKGSARTTTTGRNDTPLTPAGRNTVLVGGNSPTQEPGFPQSSASPEKTEPTFLDNASSEPPNRQKTGSTETQPINTAPTQDTALLGEYSASETPSSAQGVDESSNQATDQGKQESSVDLIANGTIENLESNLYTEAPFKDRPVEAKRNGRKINPVNERVKWFYDTFTALGVEFFEDDTFKADYIYSKNDPMYKSILTYISEGVSPYDMRMAFEHMWNEERDGQYFWQNPDTLTNRAFCKNFRSKRASAKFKMKQEERKLQANNNPYVQACMISAGQLPAPTTQTTNEMYMRALQG